LRVRPLLIPGRVRDEKVQRLANAAPIGGLVPPQVDADAFTERGEIKKRPQVELAVVPRARALQLAWLTAIRFDLPPDPVA
jgi:hypothetical protein